MKIEPTVQGILSLRNIDNFSAIEIRTAILVFKNDPTLDPSEVRRLVYAELVKFVNKGWLKKKTSKKKGITRYIKTEFFDHDAELKINSSIQQDGSFLRKELRSRLYKYNNQLLQIVGSLEEFETLIVEFPNLQANIQSKYNHTREQHAQLIGKIKTLEPLIKIPHIEN